MAVPWSVWDIYAYIEPFSTTPGLIKDASTMQVGSKMVVGSGSSNFFQGRPLTRLVE